MARRESVYVHRRAQYQSPPSPNATRNLISCEVRLFYPPNANEDAIDEVLYGAYNEALTRVHLALTEREPRPQNVWLVPPE